MLINKLLLGVYALAIAGSLTSIPANAFLLDLPRALQSEKYRADISERFKTFQELQIGGTHTYGNRTVMKRNNVPTDKLDTKILIINPHLEAHDLGNTQIMSLQADGFDYEVLRQLKELCDLFDFKFKKVYINNVESSLSIPEPYDKLRVRFKIKTDSLVAGLGAKDLEEIDDAIYSYVADVKSGKANNLYDVFYSLLQNNGIFIVKFSEQQNIFESMLGVLDGKLLDESKESIDIQNLVAPLTYSLMNKLRAIGDEYVFSSQDTLATPNPKNPFYKSQMQGQLLQNARFTQIQMSLGRFKSWGYFENLESVYSTVIRAKKVE